MADRKPDRRVPRTRHRLKSALLELIQERGYDRVSIADIADRADVGRSTFYAHFDSKEDLLFAGFDEWMLSLADAPSEGGDERRFRFSRPLLEHVRGQRRFFQAAFVKGNDARIRARFTGVLVELVGRELDRMDEKRRAGQAHALAGAFLGLVAWWLDGGSSASVDEVDRIFQSLGGLSPAAAPAAARGSRTGSR